MADDGCSPQIAQIVDYTLDRRFRPVRFKNIKFGNNRLCLVKGLIPREGLIIVWGPPKCGKSFLVFDLVMHVSLGWNYRGRRVEPGTVVYIACEGEKGLAARTEAFRIAKLAEEGCDPPFYLLSTRLDLVAEIKELIDDVRAEIGPGHCAVIVIDTLNRSIAGSENDPKDMTAYVGAADALRDAFQCAVIIIHHCGIEGTRPRGFSGLSAAADAQIAVKRDNSNRIIATLELMKDGPEGEEIASRLRAVEVGADQDDEPMTSCVVEPADAEPTAARAQPLPRLSPAAKIARDQLRKAIDETGEIPPASNHIPANTRAVDYAHWRRYCHAAQISETDTQTARQKAFQRAAEQLIASGAATKWGDWVWIS